jgi:hypothetical protein
VSRLHDESKRLFAAALAIPAEERSTLLRKACQGDEDLLAEVESLLRHHDELELAALDPEGEIGALRRTLSSVVRAWTGTRRVADEDDRGAAPAGPPKADGDRPRLDG